MFAEILLPWRLTMPSTHPLNPVAILAGIINAIITIAMVFTIAWAVHKGWNAV